MILENFRDLNPVKMLMDSLRWNMLNIIRAELFLDCYRIWDIFNNSSLQSPRGQYTIVSFLITLTAMFAFQFQILSWLLTVYSIYLVVGMCIWLHRRVYFYHRRLDSVGVNQTINYFDSAKAIAHNGNGNGTGASGTLKPDKHGHSSSSSASSSSSDTNSLQRQRIHAYRNFLSVLNEPRHNFREFAMSLTHLSQLSKLVPGWNDVFDEIHFQILATRRDVVNIILRSVLLVGATLLAYF